jgi:hypothetical protein
MQLDGRREARHHGIEVVHIHAQQRPCREAVGLIEPSAGAAGEVAADEEPQRLAVAAPARGVGPRACGQVQLKARWHGIFPRCGCKG